MKLPYPLAAYLLPNYLQKGIAVDTELLLLAAIGRYQESYIKLFKRTEHFSEEDYAILASFLAHFKTFAIPPHVLAELSNYSFQIPLQRLEAYLDKLIELLLAFREESVAKDTILGDPAFRKLGATDTALLACCRRLGYLLLTTDRRLSGTAEKNGVQTLLFNDLRLYWLAGELGL